MNARRPLVVSLLGLLFVFVLAAGHAGARPLPQALNDADLFDGGNTSYWPTVWARGAAARIEPTIQNGGMGAAGPFRVSFYLSTDTSLSGGDYSTGAVSVGGVDASGTTTAPWSGRIPATVPVGTYYVLWVIDDLGAVEESNEGNNWGFLATPITVASGPAGDRDVNGDGKPDLVFRHSVTGQTSHYFMNGTVPAGGGLGATEADVNWKIVTMADMNNDGKGDLIWRHAVTGQNRVWFMNGTVCSGEQSLKLQADMRWALVGAADFDRDGSADLVWHNRTTGQGVVWYMDGTAYTGTAALPTSEPAWSMVGTADFNGDGHPDLLWRDYGNGKNYIIYLNGLVDSGTGDYIAQAPDTTLRVVGTGDYNGDLRPDILWHNPSSGAVTVWFMNGLSLTGGVTLFSIELAWDVMYREGVVVTPGDFDVNGKADIFWRHDLTGENVVWFMDDGTYVGYAHVLAVADTAWRAEGLADFNGDGRTDILWRNATTGANVIWYMKGTTRTSYSSLLPVADTDWRIMAAADFNADGKADILWRHLQTGENVLWYMNGAQKLGHTTLLSVPDGNWKVAGAADVNADGDTDILWRNVSTGENVLWYMNGAVRTSTAALLTVADTNYAIASIADFNSDGKPDLLWRGYATGQNVLWFMDGTVRTSYVSLKAVPDTNWKAGHDPR